MPAKSKYIKTDYIQKPGINVESLKINSKTIAAGDTPLSMTLQEIGDSVVKTFREEEFDENTGKLYAIVKENLFNGQVIFLLEY